MIDRKMTFLVGDLWIFGNLHLHEVWATGRLGNQMYKKTTDIDLYNKLYTYDCIGNWKTRISLHMIYILHKHPLCGS